MGHQHFLHPSGSHQSIFYFSKPFSLYKTSKSLSINSPPHSLKNPIQKNWRIEEEEEEECLLCLWVIQKRRSWGDRRRQGCAHTVKGRSQPWMLRASSDAAFFPSATRSRESMSALPVPSNWFCTLSRCSDPQMGLNLFLYFPWVFFFFFFSLYINFHWISMEVSELFSVLKNIIWNSHLNSLIFGHLFFWVLPDLHDGVRDLTWVWFWIAKCQFFWLILFLYFLCEILQIRGWRWLMKRKENLWKAFCFLLCQKPPIQHLISWNGNRPMPWQFFYFIKF